jgi:hypothetical protein
VGNATIIVGLALVLALQVAIHLRIAGIPRRVATLKSVTTEKGSRAESDAFQEGLARRLNLIVRGIQGYHDQIAEDFRLQVAAAEQRAKLAEARRAGDAAVTADLRTVTREMADIAGELRALQGDLADLVVGARERQAAPPEAPPAAPAASPAPAPAAPAALAAVGAATGNREAILPKARRA